MRKTCRQQQKCRLPSLWSILSASTDSIRLFAMSILVGCARAILSLLFSLLMCVYF